MAEAAAAAGAPKVSRLDRRKARTRQALIDAAVRLIAEGRGDRASIQEITEEADIGFGSFYNHFDSKEELFEAAVNEALDAHGALLDTLTAAVEDPAETFARSYRLTGRLFRRRPQMCRVVLNSGLALITADRGLGPRAQRDIAAATAAGRFSVADPELAMAVAAGALLGLGQLLTDRPERDDAEATDRVTEDVLRIFGIPADEAAEICRRPLPDIAESAEGSAA